jgi:ABC-type antimicrobial peptide transport system permease subunit
MVGVFGILAYAVQHQGREFALRMALGAKLTDVARMVLGRAVRLVAAGTIIGLSLAAATSRLLSTVLFGVRPLDPLTFVFVTIVLILTAAAAAAAPAWRAVRIEPAVALRSE